MNIADATARIEFIHSAGTRTDYETPNGGLDSFEDTWMEVVLSRGEGDTIAQAIEAALEAMPATHEQIPAEAFKVLLHTSWSPCGDSIVSANFGEKGASHMRWEIHVLDGLTRDDEDLEEWLLTRDLDHLATKALAAMAA